MVFHSRILLFTRVKQNRRKALFERNSFSQVMHKLYCSSKILPSYELAERIIFQLCRKLSSSPSPDTTSSSSCPGAHPGREGKLGF